MFAVDRCDYGWLILSFGYLFYLCVECLSAHYLNCKDWMLVEETEFYYRIINKKTGTIKSVDKFLRLGKGQRYAGGSA